MLVKVDKKGRVYLPKEVREKFKSEEFFLVALPSGILLVPRVDDPLKALEEEGKKLSNVDIKVLRKVIQGEAEKEVGLR
ncbi:AbrB/MazE/SpoVT family DNA-binding domain-containing protein [Saccharolobus caldissimus]|uniref:AbrB family transcriptional regulator n=1 Tax=Saccharolobus caldissimus TaxID=1702097 RepID=A0AAQ4CU37_9CREN|nr:AbrB/MazE/SpoVT family DNA-binding domain-containing protein [Saccharolobus caldissimus]BDB99318.1 AbrB family transcriptional regulator [Saccharolobus caldissimus]